MLIFSNEFWLQISAYLISIGIVVGTVKTSLNYLAEKMDDLKETQNEKIDKLEKKQDKHNCLIERMVIVEQSTKSAHKRLDELKHNGIIAKEE